MGRLSKEHKHLTSNIIDFLLEPESIQKNLQVGLTLLESYRKTRNPQRKQRFKEELINIMKHLCVDSYRNKEETSETKKKVRRLEEHGQTWKNKYINLEMKINDALEYRQLYQDQKKSNRNAERDYGVLYRENSKLRETIEKLKEQNKALKKEAKTNSKASVE